MQSERDSKPSNFRHDQITKTRVENERKRYIQASEGDEL